MSFKLFNRENKMDFQTTERHYLSELWFPIPNRLVQAPSLGHVSVIGTQLQISELHFHLTPHVQTPV